MKTLGLIVVLGFVGMWTGCSDSETDGGAGEGGKQETSSSSSSTGSGGGGTGGAGGAGGAGGSSSGPPQAPIMKTVAPLQGGLHITWDNVTPDCEKIELDRNKDGGTFAVAFTVTGAATSQHDASAVGTGTYCYKARCIKASVTSPDSNEKCGSP